MMFYEIPLQYQKLAKATKTWIKIVTWNYWIGVTPTPNILLSSYRRPVKMDLPNSFKIESTNIRCSCFWKPSSIQTAVISSRAILNLSTVSWVTVDSAEVVLLLLLSKLLVRSDEPLDAAFLWTLALLSSAFTYRLFNRKASLQSLNTESDFSFR